jgi:membrane protein YqaA with SNARE-associated domain
MEDSTPVNPVKPKFWAWLKKRILPICGLLLAAGIFALVGYFYVKNPDFFKQDNIAKFGYAGVFIVSVFLNATIIVPVSNMTVILAMGATLPAPWLVGLIGGVGAVIGEMTGYIAGRSGRDLLAGNKVYARVEKWVKKRGWIAIFFLSAFPLFFDVVGIIAGALRMPLWEFALPTFAGRTITYTIVAYLGAYGIQLFPWFN